MGANKGYYRSVKFPAGIRTLCACFAAPWLASCAGAQSWLADEGWPAFPATQARELLDQASSLGDGPVGLAAAREAADFAYRRDLYAVALDAAELWQRRDPSDPEALASVAALRIAAGDEEGALKAARAGLLLNQDAARFIDLFARKLSGINAEMLGEDRLASVSTQFAEEFPQSQDVLKLAARAALAAGRFDLAVIHADALLKQDPDDDTSHAIAARALLRAGDPDLALARLTEQLAMRDSMALEQNYVMLLLDVGQPREALSRIRDLRGRYPDSPDLVLQEARMLRALGGGSVAQPLFVELFRRNYEPDQCRLELGRIAADRQAWLESIEWYAGIVSDQLAPAAAQGLVRAFLAQEDYDQALATVLDLVRRYPEHVFESLPLAAGVMQSAGRSSDALAAYRQALRYQPDSLRLRMARAHLLLDMKEHRRAIREMEDLVEEHPRDSEVLNALGYTLADRGIRLKEALELIRLALELEPGSPEIVDSMGWVLYRLGRTEEAVPFLEQALEDFAHPEVAAHLCEVLYELGQTARADDLLRESLTRFRDTTLLEAVQERYSR